MHKHIVSTTGQSPLKYERGHHSNRPYALKVEPTSWQRCTFISNLLRVEGRIMTCKKLVVYIFRQI